MFQLTEIEDNDTVFFSSLSFDEIETLKLSNKFFIFYVFFSQIMLCLSFTSFQLSVFSSIYIQPWNLEDAPYMMSSFENNGLHF